MPMLIRFLFLLAVVALAVWAVRRLTSGSPKLKCATCRHCRKLFEDGSLCAYGKSETFKNLVHIHNCVDYERR